MDVALLLYCGQQVFFTFNAQGFGAQEAWRKLQMVWCCRSPIEKQYAAYKKIQ